MRLEHVAIWTKNIEVMRDFYLKYFGFESSGQYSNETKGFCSYFLSSKNGARLELMQRTDVKETRADTSVEVLGLAHIAISVGSEDEVDSLTSRLVNDGYTIIDGPRRTGDGYYESIVLDPEENRLEITI